MVIISPVVLVVSVATASVVVVGCVDSAAVASVVVDGSGVSVVVFFVVAGLGGLGAESSLHGGLLVV